MIHLKYLEFENGSVQFSKEEFEKLLSEHKRNLHALWMARAYNGFNTTYNLTSYHNYMIEHPNTKITSRRWYHCWEMVERKCREKAKEFE